VISLIRQECVVYTWGLAAFVGNNFWGRTLHSVPPGHKLWGSTSLRDSWLHRLCLQKFTPMATVTLHDIAL